MPKQSNKLNFLIFCKKRFPSRKRFFLTCIQASPTTASSFSFNKAYRVDVKNMYNVMLKLNNYFEGISELSYVKKDNYSDMFYP